MSNYIFQWEILWRTFGPSLVLRRAFPQSAFADDYALRYADEFHVGEHDSRAKVAIIEQVFNPRGVELRAKLFRR